MIAIVPDEIIIETGEIHIDDDDTELERVTLDIERKEPAHDVAYVRLTPELRDFLKLCNDKHGVIGFEYDFDDPMNFGVVVKAAPAAPAEEDKKA